MATPTDRSGHGSGAEPHPLDLRRFLPYRIHQLSALIAVARSLPIAPGGELKVREWRVLMVLAAFGPLTSAAVAQRASMDTGSVARAVKPLLRLGLVDVRTPRSDRRKQVLALTGRGIAAHDEVATVRRAYSDEVLDCLAPVERDQLFHLLDRLHARALALRDEDERP